MEHPALTPVFIGGSPRSGTTMLGAMIGAHPECIVVPETHFKTLARPDVTEGAGWDARAVFAAIERTHSYRFWEHRVSLPDDLRAIDSYPKLLLHMVRSYGTARSQGRFWIDHTPDNMRFVATLRRLFPDAKFIHIVRDGRAVAASVLPLDWGPNSILSASNWWAGHLAFGLAAESAYGREAVLRVRYEQGVTEPEATVQRICAFMGLQFDPAMLEGADYRKPAVTVAQHKLVGQRPDPRRIDGWRTSLSPREIELFEARTGDLLKYLGYERVNERPAPATRYELMSLGASDAFRQQVVNRFRNYFRRARHDPQR